MEHPVSLFLGQTIASNLDPDNSNASLTFEPKFEIPVFNGSEVSLFSEINRPFDPKEDFSFPYLTLRYSQPFQISDENFSLRPSFSFIEMDRWSLEGRKLQGSLQLRYSKLLTNALEFKLTAGPSYQWNQYTMTPSGRSQPTLGFYEGLDLSYPFGKLSAQFLLALSQLKAGNSWVNAYSHRESLIYEFTDNFEMSVFHEIVSNTIDRTTGFYKPVQIADGRQSRVGISFTFKSGGI